MKYKIIVDMGIPYTEEAETDEQLKQKLEDIRVKQERENPPQCDITVLDASGIDISETPFIVEMIEELLEEQTPKKWTEEEKDEQITHELNKKKKDTCFICGGHENVYYWIAGADGQVIRFCDDHGAELYNAITEDGENLLDTLKIELGETEDKTF